MLYYVYHIKQLLIYFWTFVLFHLLYLIVFCIAFNWGRKKKSALPPTKEELCPVGYLHFPLNIHASSKHILTICWQTHCILIPSFNACSKPGPRRQVERLVLMCSFISLISSPCFLPVITELLFLTLLLSSAFWWNPNFSCNGADREARRERGETEGRPGGSRPRG